MRLITILIVILNVINLPNSRAYFNSPNDSLEEKQCFCEVNKNSIKYAEITR